jgi:hypothetical protein
VSFNADFEGTFDERKVVISRCTIVYKCCLLASAISSVVRGWVRNESCGHDHSICERSDRAAAAL